KCSTQMLLCKIKMEMTAGRTVYESIVKYKKNFSKLAIDYIKIGELSGTLDTMLKRLADYSEKTELLKKRVWKVLYYATIVLGMTIFVVCFLLIVIVPKFEQHFRLFGAKLPLFTRLVINISQILQQNWHLILITAMLAVSLFKYSTKKFSKFRRI